MGPEDSADWLVEAAEAFAQHQKRSDAARVTGCLADGLNLLRESLYLRAHHDVEQVIGVDSMLMPVSEIRTQQRAAWEIEAFEVAESTAAAERLGYVDEAETWYLPWLAGLCGAQSGGEARILPLSRAYLAKSADQRRLDFADALGRVLPESRRAPLVLFRLVPLAVQIVTALAFGDRDAASQLRKQQRTILPAIADCHECRGKVLPCDRQCPTCGNPLWKYQWLVAVD